MMTNRSSYGSDNKKNILNALTNSNCVFRRVVPHDITRQ